VKEQGFIAAGAAFYQKKPKMSHAKHTEAYSSALEKLHAQFPDDVEVSAFYALSLVALAEEDIDAMDNLKKAIAILEPLREKYPDHPDVAHYLIHAADRPELAATRPSLRTPRTRCTCHRTFLCGSDCGKTQSHRTSRPMPRPRG
jgi:hypothetical protein